MEAEYKLKKSMFMFSNSILRILIMTVGLSLACCTQKLPEEITSDVSPEKIMEFGNQAFNKKYYNQAGDYYLELNRLYPYSSLDSKALLRAVESFYRAEKYEKTRFAADKFLITYSNSLEAEKVFYLKAFSYCNQILAVDRDQSEAKSCIVSLKRFRSIYPSSKNTKKVTKQIKEAQEFLVGQELTIGKYYLKRKNPSAAIRRFKEVRKTVKYSKFIPEISYRLIEGYLMLGLVNEAIEEEKKMKKAFPNNSWTSEATQLLGKFRSV